MNKCTKMKEINSLKQKKKKRFAINQMCSIIFIPGSLLINLCTSGTVDQEMRSGLPLGVT